MITLGVVSDTHIPDRASRLNDHIVPVFEQAGVSKILHAGDVSTPEVIRVLEEIAPVDAVRGNRDWFALSHLPYYRECVIDEVKIGLTHAHGRWWNYVVDRIYLILRGYKLERFLPRLSETFPDADVIVFGHTHYPLNLRENGRLLFNPGSPHCPENKNISPSVGLIHIEGKKKVIGEIIPIDNK